MPNAHTFHSTLNSSTYSEVITPSDTVMFSKGPCKRIRVGDVSGGATLTIINLDGSTTLHENVYAAEPFDVQALGVANTGTTVSNIVAYW